jgi:hypothetical protein
VERGLQRIVVFSLIFSMFSVSQRLNLSLRLLLKSGLRFQF